jgi:hypothetical protein
VPAAGEQERGTVVPVFLEPPRPAPRGPDGQGWNRLSLNAHIGLPAAQCALQPRSYPHLVESQDTRKARWGGYGRCVTAGDCLSCRVLTGPGRALVRDTGRVLARLRPGRMVGDLVVQQSADRVFLVDDPAAGWDTGLEEWAWHELARLDGWTVGRAFRDVHSDGFWLIAAAPPGPA